jgi:WD40 repeat protein
VQKKIVTFSTPAAVSPLPSFLAQAVFGGEDFNLSFYGGPPFRYEKGLKEHANFVNCVRYAPDGSRFISVASDKVGIVYDGTTAGVIGRLDATQGHTGSIYGVSWSADGTRVVTCGGDKAVKIWDLSVEGDKFPCVATFTLGKAIEDMQEGVAWASTDLIVSLSLVRGPAMMQLFVHCCGHACAATARRAVPQISLHCCWSHFPENGAACHTRAFERRSVWPACVEHACLPPSPVATQ